MLLNGFRVLSLADDLKQIIVGEEVEARELSTLALQELIKILLDELQLLVQLLKDIDEAFHDEGTVSILLLVNALHFNLEVLVDLVEDGTLLR